MPKAPKVLVITGYGINCEEETLLAFLQAGFSGKIIHINELLGAVNILKEYQVLAIPGGFSFADETGSGNAFALKIPEGMIQEFLSKDKLLIGICNGAQILLRVFKSFGLTLLHNDSNIYQCEWVDLVIPNSAEQKCIWLRGIEKIRLPIAHGEGKFFGSAQALEKLQGSNQIAMQYVLNPNGSALNIAAITDETGRALLTMPHPERAIFFQQQDNWPELKEYNKRNNIRSPKSGSGIKIFQNAYNYFR